MLNKKLMGPKFAQMYFGKLQREALFSDTILILILHQSFFCFRILTTQCRFQDGADVSGLPSVIVGKTSKLFKYVGASIS